MNKSAIKEMLANMFKKNWKLCAVLTVILLILKFTVAPMLSWLTVTVCIWGWIFAVPLCLLLEYFEQPLSEQYKSVLVEHGIREVKTAEVGEKKFVAFVRKGVQVSVAFGDYICTYVMQSMPNVNESKIDELNDKTDESYGYYYKNGIMTQKHAFYANNGKQVYQMARKDVKTALEKFETVKGENNER